MLTFLLTLTLLHPVHATFAEWEWNADSKRVELALRLDVLDEQTIDRDQAKKRARGNNPVAERPSNEQRVESRIQYLAKHFRFNVDSPDSKSNPKHYKWIGREEKGAHVWWYVEIQTKDDRPPTKLRNTMLFHLDERFVHQVRCRNGGKSITMTFRHDKPSQTWQNTND